MATAYVMIPEEKYKTMVNSLEDQPIISDNVQNVNDDMIYSKPHVISEFDADYSSQNNSKKDQGLNDMVNNSAKHNLESKLVKEHNYHKPVESDPFDNFFIKPFDIAKQSRKSKRKKCDKPDKCKNKTSKAKKIQHDKGDNNSPLKWLTL